MEARAAARDAHEAAAYAAKVQEREERARRKGRKPGGRPPKPPTPGPRDKDQYNVTDPESRIMKNSTDAGFAQSYNVQVAVDQASMVIVSQARSNHPIDQHEIPPTVPSIAPDLGQPEAVALDAGYFSAATAWCATIAQCHPPCCRRAGTRAISRRLPREHPRDCHHR